MKQLILNEKEIKELTNILKAHIILLISENSTKSDEITRALKLFENLKTQGEIE